MARGPKIFKQLALSVAATAVALLLAEVALRWLAPQQLVDLRPDVWVPDDGLGWKRAGNLDTAVNTGGGQVRLLTDGEGHRIPKDSLPEARRRILALGDSFVAGLQVEAEDSLTEGISRRLTDILGEPVAVTNAAVSGWGPEQYLEAARRELPRQPYDLVLVFLFVGNDPLLERQGTIPPRLPIPRRSLRWPRSLHRWEILSALAYPVNDALEQRSHLYVGARQALRFPLQRAGLAPRRLSPVFLDRDPLSHRWEVTGHICREIADLAEEQGAGSLVILLPGVYQVDPKMGERFVKAAGRKPGEVNFRFPNDQLLLSLRKHALVASDPTPTLQRASRRGAELFGRVDTHFSAEGHSVVAAYVAPQVAALFELQGKAP